MKSREQKLYKCDISKNDGDWILRAMPLYGVSPEFRIGAVNNLANGIVESSDYVELMTMPIDWDNEELAIVPSFEI